MRIALVAHGFPPDETTGVECHTARLAAALARAGHAVEVFTRCSDPRRPHLSQRRELRDGFGLTRLALNEDPRSERERREPPGAAAAFGRFLERERPEVVHFQHLIRLGPALVDEARRRGLPTVYTAHDPYPVCSDYLLLAPDLRPLAPDDLEAQARCELARAFLAGRGVCAELVLRGELRDADAARLGAILDGAADAELGPVRERIAAERDEKLAALRRVDVFLAPTRGLARTLEEGGLGREVELMACGIEVALFAAAPAPGTRASGPLRFGFLGGIQAHKGAHVLLEAFARRRADATLSIRGGPTRGGYVDFVRARAREVGADFEGACAPERVPAYLASIDVLVVPSIWPENAPFVVREAFAAGRPVLASDVGAMRESVRDGVDGLLVAPGDAPALSAALDRLARERGLVARLAAGIEPVRTIDDETSQLTQRYAALAAARSGTRAGREADLPAHLVAFRARIEALDALPQRDLVRRAAEGVARLEAVLGGRPAAGGSGGLLGAALEGGERLRERLEDLERAGEWRSGDAAHDRQALAALRAEIEWRRGLLDERGRRLEWLQGLLAERDARLAAGESELSESRAAGRSLAAEADWQRETLAALRAELEWVREPEATERERAEWLDGERAERERALEHERAERESAREEVERLRSELGRARSDAERRLDEYRRTLAAYDRARHENERLARHETWLRGELAALASALAGEARERPAPDRSGAMISAALGEIRALREELRWRAAEMRGGAHEARALGARLFGGKLRDRARRWEEES